VAITVNKNYALMTVVENTAGNALKSLTMEPTMPLSILKMLNVFVDQV
jgi:hypothetical protein